MSKFDMICPFIQKRIIRLNRTQRYKMYVFVAVTQLLELLPSPPTGEDLSSPLLKEAITRQAHMASTNLKN